MTVGIVGHGVVGAAMARFVGSRQQHHIVVYDKFIAPYQGPERKAAINRCDLVFLCVPTPPGADGMSCDLSAVEECASWITAPLYYTR